MQIKEWYFEASQRTKINKYVHIYWSGWGFRLFKKEKKAHGKVVKNVGERGIGGILREINLNLQRKPFPYESLCLPYLKP